MENYFYKAYDQAGTLHEGEIAARDTESAKNNLKNRGLLPVAINKVSSQPKLKDLLAWNRVPGLEDLEFLSAKLSLLLKNGIRVDQAFKLSQKGTKNKIFLDCIESISAEIRKGTRLSEALKKFPEIFDPLYVSIVSIGEATGHLAEAFAGITANLSFKRRIASQTRQAMIYPLIIMLVCFGSVLFTFNFIVPKLSVVFAGVEDLPLYTTLLLGTSEAFQRYQVFILAGLVGLVFLTGHLRRKAWFQQWKNSLLLKIPLLRELVLALENLRFVSALALLLKNGVLLADALDYAVKTIGNVKLRKKMSLVRGEVRHGGNLSEAMNKTGFLPEDFDGLIEVGEQTGHLAEIFTELEERLQDRYEKRIESLIALIEPVMIVIMGAMVGSIVIIMLMSLVSINDVGF